MDGTPFGRYRLIKLIGRGGMGEVWRAHDTETDRIVAIKLLPAHFSDNKDFQQRFRREAHAAAQLNTPHVIPIHHYGEIDGRLYVDMRLIEGRDLQAVLADGPLEPGRAVRITEGAAKALQAAHEVGLVHRDVKPSNILLDRDDFPYLIDFGIARALEDTRMTATGSTIGTFQYMAPERLGDHPTDDARADIYALTCVLYECLTGQPPFAGVSMGSLVAAHLNTSPPKPSSTQPDVPAQVDQVIATGMAKDPDHRYSTTVELAKAAREAITTPVLRSTVPAQPPMQPVPAPTAPRAIADWDWRAPSSPVDAQRQVEEVSTQRREPLAARPPTSTPPSRPWWRREAVVISTTFILVLVAAVIVVALATMANRPSSQGAPTTNSSTPAPLKPKVYVYNISGVAGAAARAGQKLTQAGWNVTVEPNLDLPGVTATTVFYTDTPEEEGAALAVAKVLDNAPVAFRTSELLDFPPGLIVTVTG